MSIPTYVRITNHTSENVLSFALLNRRAEIRKTETDNLKILFKRYQVKFGEEYNPIFIDKDICVGFSFFREIPFQNVMGYYEKRTDVEFFEYDERFIPMIGMDIRLDMCQTTYRLNKETPRAVAL